LILSLATPQAANRLIERGLMHNRFKLWVRKLLCEPRRCLKCHEIGASHQASNCPVEESVCGTCSGPHDTRTCTVDSPADYFCANCRTKGHTAWGRTCSMFMACNRTMREKQLENQYLLYPIEDEPTSWTLQDGTIDIDFNAPPTAQTPKP